MVWQMLTAFNTYDYPPSVYSTAWCCGQEQIHPILCPDFTSFWGEEFKVKCNIEVISNSLSHRKCSSSWYSLTLASDAFPSMYRNIRKAHFWGWWLSRCQQLQLNKTPIPKCRIESWCSPVIWLMLCNLQSAFFESQRSDMIHPKSAAWCQSQKLQGLPACLGSRSILTRTSVARINLAVKCSD